MNRRLVVALGLIGAVGIVAPTGSTSAAPKKEGPTKKAPKKITVPKQKLKAVEFMVGSGGSAFARKGWSYAMVCSKAMYGAKAKAKNAAEGMCKKKGGSRGGGKFFDLTTTKEQKGDIRKCVAGIKYRLRCVLKK